MKLHCTLPLLLCAPCVFAAPVPLLHMDAAQQKTLRQQASLPPLSPNQPADIVLAKYAGGELRALQSEVDAQRPVYTTDGTAAMLRFDGVDDFLALSGPRKLAPAVTVFVLAAPKTNPGFFRGFFACSEWGKND